MADPDRTVLTESDITDPGPLRTALNNSAGAGPVKSVNGKTGDVTLSASDIDAPDNAQVSGSYFDLSGTRTPFGPGEAESIGTAVENVSASFGLINLQISTKADKTHATQHATGGADPITPESIGAASLNYSSEPDELFSNPFLRKSLGGWSGGGWSWAEDSSDLRGILFSGSSSGYGERIACEPGTTVTMHAFVMPHPTEAASPVKLAMQKTTLGAASFSYDGDYIRETQWVSVPEHGVSLTATFTVDTDGFRPRIQSGTGRLVYLSIAVGDVAPSPFHAPETFRGTGSPEGVISAPVGSTYVDNNATAGAIEWIKASGTSSIGWKVSEGDTGWRSIGVDNGWTGDLLLRRTGDWVTIIGMNLNGAAASNSNLYNGIPVGFRVGHLFPTYGVGSTTSTNGGAAQTGAIGLLGGGNNQILRASSPSSGWTNGSAQLSFPTSESWPTSLPGTPA